MNGSETLVETLVNHGIEVCFANSGTSEMNFVAALEEVEGMRLSFIYLVCGFDGLGLIPSPDVELLHGEDYGRREVMSRPARAARSSCTNFPSRRKPLRSSV